MTILIHLASVLYVAGMFVVCMAGIHRPRHRVKNLHPPKNPPKYADSKNTGEKE